jgi:hypothetical protein
VLMKTRDCIICGEHFDVPCTHRNKTCSPACAKVHKAKNLRLWRARTPESVKISVARQGREKRAEYSRLRYARLRRERPRPPIIRNCEECGIPFRVRTNGVICGGEECRRARLLRKGREYRAREKLARPPKLCCECGAPVPSRRNDVCSPACREERERRLKWLWYRKNPERNRMLGRASYLRRREQIRAQARKERDAYFALKELGLMR